MPQVLHFGASARNRQAGNDQPLFAYGNETGQTTRAAELRLTNAPVVTGRIGEEDTFWGLEAAALWGPLSLQGEYGQLDVDLPGSAFVRNNPPGPGQLTTIANPFIGVPNPTFNAWYVEGSWFFGGHKTYEQGGRWGRPKIDNPMFHGSGGWGALQLVGKYDVLDQSDTCLQQRWRLPTYTPVSGFELHRGSTKRDIGSESNTPLRGVTYRFEKGLKLERHMRPHLLPAYYTCLRTRKKMGAF